MKAVRLRCEYLKDPVGIDIVRPRLMWNCEDGVKQTAYELEAVSDEGRPLWRSGAVESSSMLARYAGKPLASRAAVRWRVRLRDENGVWGEWSEWALFELGLLSASDWEAKWISGGCRVNRRRRYPVDCFRRRFTVGDIKRARLYITACGLYEARINGRRAGDFVLAPGITDYRKRVQYQCCDVAALLREGENELTVQLADGWYRGSCGAWGLRNQYGTETKLLARLELTGADGFVHSVVSSADWDWSNDGPIRFADNQDGEIVDARMNPSYSGRARVTKHPVVPTSSDNVPVTEHERFSPSLITTPSGKKVLDFGQNIAGYVRFSLDAEAGQVIKLRFGELLGKDGEFTQSNIQCATKKRATPLQQVIYTCREGRNDYRTTFAIFGFQYVLVETDAPFAPGNFEAIAVYSDMERTGWFESSNPLLDRFVENTVWSAKNNHADLPTDCPTRERHGWTGDAQLFCGTACYLFDYEAMARKYERDLTDAQHKNGCFTQIAPVGGVDFYMNTMDGSPGWSDAGVFIPWELFRMYGDIAILEDNYEAMRRFAKYKQSTLGKHYLTAVPTGVGRRYRKGISNYGQSYGEWAEPEDVNAFRISDFVSPHPEETTAYIVLLMERMAEIAAILGRPGDAAEYSAVAQRVRKGYQQLVQGKRHSLDTDRQAKLVRPLYMRLLTDEQRRYAEGRLLRALEDYGWRLGTGFLSTPLILYVLADMDIEYAYRLLENEEIPGWLSMPKNGATTIWESWEGPNAQGGVASLDHYSKGAVCQWLFDSMCGINLAGENRFLIAPRPGGHFTHASAEYLSVYGMVKSGWARGEGKTEFTVTVPANCTALVRLPDGSEREQGPGVRRYSL